MRMMRIRLASDGVRIGAAQLANGTGIPMTSSAFQLSSDAEENYETFFSPLMAPFVEAAVTKAELTHGASILDVACGTGFVARAAARAVGPRGRVAAVDIHRPRLDFAPCGGGAGRPGDRVARSLGGADALP